MKIGIKIEIYVFHSVYQPRQTRGNGKNRSVSNKEYIFSPFPRGALKSLFELEIVYFFLSSADLNWTYPKQVLSRKYLKYSNCTSLDSRPIVNLMAASRMLVLQYVYLP